MMPTSQTRTTFTTCSTKLLQNDENVTAELTVTGQLYKKRWNEVQAIISVSQTHNCTSAAFDEEDITCFVSDFRVFGSVAGI
jgi:hypothetical protein